MREIPFQIDAVREAFEAFASPERQHLMMLRARIFDEAASMEGVGVIEEALRWGQPAYLTPSGSGSMLRLGAPKAGGYAIYAHCGTSLIEEFRAVYGNEFRYDGKRGVVFEKSEAPPLGALSLLIRNALNYNLRAKG